MRLFSKVLGEGQDLIILHGLYGAGDNWLTVARQLSDNFKVHLIDQRNHGSSTHAKDHSYLALAGDLKEYIEENNIKSPILLGHSMGGKTVMWFSIFNPEVASKLIIVDISPVNYSQISTPSSLIEQHLNIVNAMRLVDLTVCKTRNDIDRELAAYIRSDKIRQFLLKSIDREKDGTFKWKLNVNAISNYLPEIMKGIDIEKYASRINPQIPVLFIRGELSDYVPDEDLDKINKLYPQVEIETILGSGHWIHAEKPEAFILVVKRFLGLIE